MDKNLEKYLGQNAKRDAERDYFSKELGYVPENKDELYAAIDYISRENGLKNLGKEKDFEAERIARTRKEEIRRYIESQNGRLPSNYAELYGDDFMQERIARTLVDDGRDF